MEPITMTTTFASIVGLIGVFKSERRAEESTTLNQYIDWLRRGEHDELVKLILANADLSRSLEALLNQQHSDVMNKLEELDKVLIQVASHLTDFKPIASAMPVQSHLSDQAIDILHQLNAAKASCFMELKTLGGTSYPIWDGNRGNINISESRFIEDDFATLCDLGFLMVDFRGSKGRDRYFTITRAGAAVGG